MHTWLKFGLSSLLRLARMNIVADSIFQFTTMDIEFKNALAANKRTYMMPVSPWFYANMPGYHKNWVWKGDSLWYDRWNQIFALQPEYVQILSWNGRLSERQLFSFPFFCS